MSNTDKLTAKSRITKLKTEIDYHRYLYHVLDKQEISEAALDSLKHELALLEEKYPEFITPDSPTQRVAGQPLDEFKKIKHEVPMLSLNDVFSETEIQEWENRMKRILPEEKVWDYYAELKMDGLAISLFYNNGILSIAATRGDGKTGEDVTQNIKTIESIPLNINLNIKEKIFDYEKKFGKIDKKVLDIILGRFEVRGEVFMPLKSFEEINIEQKNKGEEPFANPRNAAAGSIRQLDSKIVASRKLEFYAYDIVTDFGQTAHEQVHQMANLLGFKTGAQNRYCRNLSEVEKFHKDIFDLRGKLEFQIDGIVAVVNNLDNLKKLGVVGKAPRGMIAYKFPAEQATTIVKDIIIQVGRTGALTPVAILEPVKVAGSTVARATLHNEDEIIRKDIRLGDTVIIQKAGDVIPEIISPMLRMRTGGEKKFVMPKKCPVCGSDVLRITGEAISRCINKQCFAQNRRQLFHFVSKNALDIEGLGPKIINQLIANGLVNEPSDFFHLSVLDLEHLERFAEKKANNIIESIRARKTIPLSRFLFALGIRHVGELMATDLAKFLSSENSLRDCLEKAKTVNKEQWLEIEGIGDIVAESLVEYFSNQANIKLIEKLITAGVDIEKSVSNDNLPLSNKTFLFTGTLTSMSRDRAKELVKSLGAKAVNSISQETTYLVAGENPGSKLAKAQELGVKIISENEFLAMVDK